MAKAVKNMNTITEQATQSQKKKKKPITKSFSNRKKMKQKQNWHDITY